MTGHGLRGTALRVQRTLAQGAMAGVWWLLGGSCGLRRVNLCPSKRGNARYSFRYPEVKLTIWGFSMYPFLKTYMSTMAG